MPTLVMVADELYRADAALHLGKVPDAQRLVDLAARDGASSQEVDHLEKDLVRARGAKGRHRRVPPARDPPRHLQPLTAT